MPDIEAVFSVDSAQYNLMNKLQKLFLIYKLNYFSLAPDSKSKGILQVGVS